MHENAFLVGFLCLGLALSGCLGGDDNPSPSDGNSTTPSGTTGTSGTSPSGTSPTSSSPGSSPPPGTGGGNNTTRPGGGNVTWQEENRTGNVAGTALPGMEPQKEETVTVSNGTMALTINVTVDGDPLDVAIYPPDCTEDSCATTGEAGGSPFTSSFDAPAEGAWTVALTAQGLGPVQSDYTMLVRWSTPAP